tara:strand:- start:207 stop:650 length:444 start_codon:yes stop_codon:yes gene_type:complete
MAYFAKLDLNNRVITINSVHNNELLDSNGVEQEILGVEFLKTLFNEPEAVWKQTSYNTIAGEHKSGKTPLRKNYASIGSTYDEDKDAFIPVKSEYHPSFVLNETTCQWEPPVPEPTEVLPANQGYSWNEDTLTWDIITYDDLGLVIS